MVSNFYYWWKAPFVLALLRLLCQEARLSHARRKGDSLVFRVGRGTRIIFLVGICGFLYGILASIGQEETWLLVFATVLVFLACLAWPVTIVLDDQAITRYLWWKRKLRISWEDVSGIEKNTGGDIEVFGKQAQCIAFTRFHVDPFRFKQEVLRRAHPRGVLDATALPTIRA